ncbi:MAG TPA: tetratricopeptide repeat protein [Tepidisphaeraceae bacterium]|jgi:tetratricopeptide (TPR) repeat protein|nr:tetratricopeptide repeat protein [Tepidisphaeraceae bacterium]
MSEASHTILWKRVTSALHGRAVGPASSQGALAAEARTKLGTDLVERFLNGYFFERQYGGGNSAMTEEQAEALVRQIENLPQPVAPAPVDRAVPRGVILEADKPMSAGPILRDWSMLEEAEAYGEDERRGSPLDALRQLVLEWRVRGDARRRERERLKVAAVEARESEARARARLKEQASARRTEEEAAARQHAQQKAAAEKQQREARAAAEAESLLQTAGKLRGEGDKRGAVAVLGKLVRQQPDSAMGWFTLGWYFGRDGNFRRSTRCYKNGLKLDPGQKTAWNNLGHDLRGMRRYKASEQALRQAIKLDPDYVTAWANLGTTLREMKNLSEAASAFHEVVRHRETDGAAWYWLGVCRAGCGDHRGAVEALQRASVMHPDNASLWIQLADSLRRLGRTEEAAQARAKANALGIPTPRLRREVPLLALVAVIASFGADRLGSTLLGLAATGAFAAMVARLSLDRVRFFWIAVLALPLLALQFIEAPHAAPIAMGVLLVWTAAVTKIWRYQRGKSATGSPQTPRANQALS